MTFIVTVIALFFVLGHAVKRGVHELLNDRECDDL